MRALLPLVVAALGCVSAPSRQDAGAPGQWPRGTYDARRQMFGVAFGAPGRIRFKSTQPLYVTFLELRSTRDSLDVLAPSGALGSQAITGPIELEIGAETVDAMAPMTASQQHERCTVMRTAGGDIDQSFCPVSRDYRSASGSGWSFRNPMFMLLSTEPLAQPTPGAIRWEAQRTVPPVAKGTGWTVVPL
ncbi:MAG: hypothetical protein U0163_20330 [Gemmatimonadaceae bacterium]